MVHTRVVHNPNNNHGGFHCSVCNRRFSNKYRRDIHEKRHKAQGKEGYRRASL